MPKVATDSQHFRPHRAGGWWFHRWSTPRVIAGISDRHTERSVLLRALGSPPGVVEAEQVHGASVGIVEGCGALTYALAGCDALLTSQAGLPLVIRTADCLPMFFADPSRGVIGIAHAGWRGLAAQLPLRVIAAFRHAYQSAPEALRVAIGPSIRVCCYEVGPELERIFGAFVRARGGRSMCDLVGAALAQLRQGGVRPTHVTDSHRCTSCDQAQWYSVRREGEATGRLTSVIMLT